jgi:predicted nucleotidyltransferase
MRQSRDLASSIVLPTNYEHLRNKKEFSEFIQSVQTNAHEQSFANDEAMQRQNQQMCPQLAFNIFIAYLESIVCTENDNKVAFDHDRQAKQVCIRLAPHGESIDESQKYQK